MVVIVVKVSILCRPESSARKVRTTRRKGFPIVSPLLFYPWRLLEVVSTHYRILKMFLRINRICKNVRKDPANKEYTDLAMTQVDDGTAERLDMYQHTDDAKLAYKKANT